VLRADAPIFWVTAAPIHGDPDRPSSVDKVAGGQLDPLVTEVRPLDAADEALALVEDGHATGKVVLIP
jgi:NADPH:quinone reductase-like Zn-dependent oxidoreductase